MLACGQPAKTPVGPTLGKYVALGKRMGGLMGGGAITRATRTLVAILALLLTSQAAAQSYAVDQQSISLGRQTLSGGTYSLDGRIELASQARTVAGGDFSLQGRWGSLAEPFGFGMVPLISPNHAPVPGTLTVQAQPGRVLKVHLSRLLGAAQDVDGDPLRLEVYPSSEGGAAVYVQGLWLIYDPGGRDVLPDLVYYEVTDERDWVQGALAIVATPESGNPGQNLVSLRLQGEDAVLDFVGIPNRTYLIQTTSELGTVWLDLGSATADRFGRFQFMEAGGATSATRYYRTVAP